MFQGGPEYPNPPGDDIGGPDARTAERAPRCSLAFMKVRILSLLSLAVVSCAVAPCARAEWMERTEAIMGTRVYVELWAEDPARGNEAIEAVMADMRRIDDLMSHYKPESELSKINAHAYQEPVQVDKELFDLIKLSTYYSQITRGRLRHHLRQRRLSVRLSPTTSTRARRRSSPHCRR